jgi:fermentation-respiration switch protein FrsA (DUF1100 family)
MKARLLLALIAFAGCRPAENTPVAPSPTASSPPARPAPARSEDTTGPNPAAKTAPRSAEAPLPAATVDPTPAASHDANKGATPDELLLFFPSRYPQGNWKPAGLTFEDVWFNAQDGTRLHGWYCPCDKPRAALLYCHGNGGNLSFGAPLLAYFQSDLRLSVLTFDYRGYGRSDGVPSVAGILEDARAARTELAERSGMGLTQQILMGRSLGGAVAVQLAAELPPRGLVLESTFSSLGDVATHLYPRLAWLVPADKLNSVDRIAKYHGPLLQSHGDADRTIPFALGRKLFEAANEPKQFIRIPGGGHNSPLPAGYYRQLDQFLNGLPTAASEPAAPVNR